MLCIYNYAYLCFIKQTTNPMESIEKKEGVITLRIKQHEKGDLQFYAKSIKMTLTEYLIAAAKYCKKKGVKL